MEDQQPAAGDLTADGRPRPEEACRARARAPMLPVPADCDAADEAAVTPRSADADCGSGIRGRDARRRGERRRPSTNTGRRPGRNWLAGKRLAIAVAVAAALFVGSAAFAGATVQPYLTDRAAAATKLKVARTAANAITTLWTYTPENMDKLADRAAGYLSGDFEAQYRKFVDAIVAPNKQAKITNTTEVTGAAVESLDDAECRRHRVHQHHVHQPADQEHPVAEVPVLPAVHETRQRPLAGDQDDDHHLAGFDAARIRSARRRRRKILHPMAVTSPVSDDRPSRRCCC